MRAINNVVTPATNDDGDYLDENWHGQLSAIDVDEIETCAIWAACAHQHHTSVQNEAEELIATLYYLWVLN